MLVDGRSVPDGTTVEADVCIIGAGAAGITLARELIRTKARICLLESGGFSWNARTQELYDGPNLGRPYFPLDICRLRYFGGTTNHWGGLCMPLDPIDFEAREWIPYSGWPFGRAALDPYYRRAHEVCQLGPYRYDPAAWQDRTESSLPCRSDVVRTTIFQFSPPTRFGVVYRDAILAARNITTLIHSNVTELIPSQEKRAVSRARVATFAGNEFSISAKLFVVATGGIENPRLLLVSRRSTQAGLGNEHDLVGRFFMEHLVLEQSKVEEEPLLLPSARVGDMALYTQKRERRGERAKVFGALVLAPGALRTQRLLNFSVQLRPVTMVQSRGYKSLKMVLNALRRGELPDNFTRHLRSVIQDLDGVAEGLVNRGEREVMGYTLLCRAEQAPDPESRVMLTEEKDELGIPRAALKWRVSERDLSSFRGAQEILAREIGRAGLGRVRLPDNQSDRLWPQDITGGFHLMGTTRMARDPKQGVVDEHCRVHGIGNLYIAGSSVFPTVGYANPTLTIVALAIRLADRIKEALR